ncbi:sulfotransferase [Cyanobacterium aponinum AL20118]|uniref:Sulfotransferase n=1 Tax=Cyanobacterium aponinum AL20115 TaxID=3090662 RepID=A0AAF0ZCU5_9CHRO|nr:sulfotransferase [Cyanobacterium aponinum]WPF89310.1 sulfotransferase [Cyanobacterium aponinum AL20115]
MNKKPDFLIIGAMKCATSTLHEQLALQSGIFMTKLKEPNFFSNDEIYKQGMTWYLSQFQGAQLTDLCGESSTHYTKLPTYPQTVDRIKVHLPNAKFIYVMRHPIDRLISQYIHEWTQRVINININQAIYDYPELISYSQYTMQLQPFLETFDRERILLVFFERLLQYPQTELERIANFIGYKSSVKWHDLSAVNVSQERMRKSEWRDFFVEAPILKQIRKKFIPQDFRDWIKSLWMMKEKPQLTQESRKYLKSIFDQDLQILGQWLGVELNCDNYKLLVKELKLDSHQ